MIIMMMVFIHIEMIDNYAPYKKLRSDQPDYRKGSSLDSCRKVYHLNVRAMNNQGRVAVIPKEGYF